MARQKDVIEPREFESETILRQWHRTIGLHRYRFRVDSGPKRWNVTVERAIANRQWELIHQWMEFRSR